jgi:hypothetical protein
MTKSSAPSLPSAISAAARVPTMDLVTDAELCEIVQTLGRKFPYVHLLLRWVDRLWFRRDHLREVGHAQTAGISVQGNDESVLGSAANPSRPTFRRGCLIGTMNA